MNERQGLRETALVLRYQAGDASAIEPLVEQYDGRLRYFVRRLLGNGTDERDIMQDVWLKAIRGLPRLRDPSLLAPWLYRIARNKVYNHLRDRKIHHPVSDEDLAVEDDPAAPLHAAHTAARVHECLMQLNPIHREALLLRFLQDMPYDAMAHVMACGVGTPALREAGATGAIGGGRPCRTRMNSGASCSSRTTSKTARLPMRHGPRSRKCSVPRRAACDA